MRKSSYDTWAMRIDEAIREHARGPDGARGSVEEMGVKELLLAFAAEAGAIVGAIGRNVEAVQVSGNDRLSALQGIIDDMLPHRAFSLLEYRYTLPTGEQPGLRLRVDLDAEPAHIEVQRFDDLRRWRVDPAARQEFDIPIRFQIEHSSLRAVPDPDAEGAFATCTDWQTALRETLALPFRHLYDRSVRAS
jgi:hypothetical protein